MTPRIQGIDHIHVYVPDRPQAEEWYREVLGFERVAALEDWSAGGGPLTSRMLTAPPIWRCSSAKCRTITQP